MSLKRGRREGEEEENRGRPSGSRYAYDLKSCLCYRRDLYPRQPRPMSKATALTKAARAETKKIIPCFYTCCATPHALPCCLLFPNRFQSYAWIGLRIPPSPFVSYLIIEYGGAQASQEQRSDLALFPRRHRSESSLHHTLRRG